MDLQSRKLNMINYLVNLQDELIVGKIEKIINKSQLLKQNISKPMTANELVLRIKKSESDYFDGRITYQEDIEKISANW